MEFQDWFTHQFGLVPKESLQELQNEISSLQEKLARLKEKRFKVQEYHSLFRASMYAWNASKSERMNDDPSVLSYGIFSTEALEALKKMNLKDFSGVVKNIDPPLATMRKSALDQDY
jgi:hypothetical protein